MTADHWPPGRAIKLMDRRSESALLLRLVDAVRSGESRALVVHGDPGVGKTALLDYLAGRASEAGCRVAHATGVQSEMELAFSGLHQLCAPLLSRAERLPEPQRDALRDEDARALLEASLAAPLDAQVRDLIVAETRGNPLALLADRIEDSFLRQLEALPEPTRRAWHRAQATAGQDEEVAAELVRSAGRAQARGGIAAAAAFLQRAVALTVDPVRRAERTLAAAQASFQAGAFDAALRLAAMAADGPLDEFQGARAGLLRAHVAFASGLGSDAPALLLQAAGRLERFDLNLARETYLAAWGAAGMAERRAGGDVLLEICRAVQALPPSQGAPRPLDLLLSGLARLITDGPAAAAATLQRATEELTAIPAEDVLRWGWMATAAYSASWDFDGLHAISGRQVQLIRAAGAIALLPLHLSQLGMALPWMGDFAGTAAVIAETDSVAAATGSPIAPFTEMKLRALQGLKSEASVLIATAIEHAVAEG